MKKLVVLLMSVFVMSSVVPVYAEKDSSSKDECLLAMENCSNQVDSLQQKIKRITKEINKGTKVYTAEELKKLNDKLKEANDFLDYMVNHP